MGGPYEYGGGGGPGYAWAFTRSGSTWTRQSGKLGGAAYRTGFSAGLSANGNILALGGYPHAPGSVTVYTRHGGQWTPSNPPLTGADESGVANLGWNLRMSGDGDTLLVGGLDDDEGTGAVWPFVYDSPPLAETGEAAAIDAHSATLYATVRPEGQPVTECVFEYGPSASYGASVPCSQEPGLSSEPVQVSGAVEGLDDPTTYHFRILMRTPVGVTTVKTNSSPPHLFPSR